MEDFKVFALDAINRNNKMIVNKKKLEVDILSKFADIFIKHRLIRLSLYSNCKFRTIRTFQQDVEFRSQKKVQSD